MTLNDASRDVLIDEERTPGLSSARSAYDAAVERQVDDLVAADHLAAIARVGFEHANRAGDLDRFADAADLQRQIDALPRVDGDGHVRRDRLGETRQLRFEAIGADADVQELIVAGGVGHRGRGDAGGLIGQRDGGAGHGRAGLIDDAAEHGGGIELGARRRGQGQDS